MKTCLVVDDSKVVRQLARKMVESLSFKVNEAEDGKKALESCDQEIPDVILLDWNMPVMDGMTFLKEFKVKYPTAKSVVIFCTTENEISKIELALTAGANEYIMKPFDVDIIRDKFLQTGVL